MMTRARTGLPFVLALISIGAAGCRRPAPLPPAPAKLGVATPAPGADLEAPPPAPAAGLHRSAGLEAGRPLDLGADRPATPVAVPTAPRGASIGFVFGDERRGWVTHIPDSLQLPAVAYGDGKVFVSGGFETYSFYALDADEGRIVWVTAQLPDNGPTAPIYEDEGDDVIFNTESCTLVCLAAKTGKLRWAKRLGDPTLAQVAAAKGLVFAAHPGEGGPRLSAFRVADGARVWSRPVDGELYAAPVVEGDSVYASTVGGRSYRFEAATGKMVWSRALRATTAPFIAGGELFVSRREGGREAQIVVSAATGAILRAHAASPAPYLTDVPQDETSDNWKQIWAFEGSRPVIARGVRYVARGGVIEADDPASGAAYWSRTDAKARGKRSVGSVAVAGSQLVVSTRAGQLYGLDVDTGYTLWAYDVGHPVVAEPIVARGWVYVATADGLVVALQVADPTLDGWHMFGGNSRHNGPVEPRAS
jgi:Ca-activated chloride channel family protein